MSKFTNTRYADTIDHLVDATKGVLKNPFYIFSDKKPTKVTYYRQNKEKSTLDPESGLNYENIGEQSPIKFNKIEDMYLYGLPQMPTTYDGTEFGLEVEEISGEFIVPPNAIEPLFGDYFTIPYANHDILFRVHTVNNDTLDNGTNVWQGQFKLERSMSIAQIEKQVVGEYKFLINNVGTDFKCTVEDKTYDLIRTLEDTMEEITAGFQIFFDPKVQIFSYRENGFNFYDPYLIEFMIRNQVMSHGSEFIHVSHGASTSKTFGYEYTKTIYYLLEHPEEVDSRRITNMVTATMITDINSLMTTRMEKYYQINYNDSNPINSRFEVFPGEVLSRIKSGTLYHDSDPIEKKSYNLLIAYFKNDRDYLKGNLLDMIRQLDNTPNKDLFYLTPINIFIINRFIQTLLKK